MPSSLNGTGVTFNDGTQLNSRNEAGGDYIPRIYTSPATWTKPAGLKGVRVSVLAGGGGGGGVDTFPQAPSFFGGNGGMSRDFGIGMIPASNIPGPVTVTVGTGGAPGGSGGGNGGGGGTSSFGGFISITGGAGGLGAPPARRSNNPASPGGIATAVGGVVLIAPFSVGAQGQVGTRPTAGQGSPGVGRGAGGAGSASAGSGVPFSLPSKAGGAGTAGVVIIEEFY